MINKILQRTSCRDYKELEFDTRTIDIFKDIVNSSPTSSNGHHFGCMFVTDPKLKDEISSILYSSQAIKKCSLLAIFYIENNRIELIEEITERKLNTDKIDLFATSVIDCSISATMLQDVAISLGYGTCFLGMVRAFPNQLINKLNLGNNIPMVGLTIGIKNSEEDIKPKLNKVSINTYDIDGFKKELKNYDIAMKEYYLNRNKNNKDNDFLNTFMNSYKYYEDNKIYNDISELICNAYKIKKI